MEKTIISKSKEQTIQLGIFISQYLFQTSVITLTGDLGAGKTTFTSGVAKGLGVSEKVSSPTFNIMKCYFKGKLPLYHIDAYRLEDGTNKDIGLEEYIEGDGVCLIEWPNYIKDLINTDDVLEIEIYHKDQESRVIVIKSINEQYKALFEALKEY